MFIVFTFCYIFVLLVFSKTIEYSISTLTKEETNLLYTDLYKDNKNVKLYTHNPSLFLASLYLIEFISIITIVFNLFLTYRYLFPVFDFISFIVYVVISFVVLVFASIIFPKNIVKDNSLKYFVKTSNFVYLVSIIFYPIVKIIEISVVYIKKRTDEQISTDLEELTDAIESSKNDEINEDERNILKSMVNFSNIEVKEIMKSRVDVVAVEYDDTFETIYKTILDSGYSRMPVYKQSFDNILGILYIKDLLQFLNEKNNNFDWHSLIRKPVFVPEKEKIIDLLKELQEKKVHLSIVVDEYGGTSGIVTLEDIMEEVVGEINDEFDSEEIIYTKINNNNYIFEGKTSLNDFCKITHTETDFFDDIKGDSDSLAGLILEQVGKIPDRNQAIEIKNFIFKIESADVRRIKKIRVIINDKPETI